MPVRGQRLADAVRRDQGDLTCQATKDIASLGHHGKYKGNLARDFDNYCQKLELTGHLEPYLLETEIQDHREKIVAGEAAVFVPHEVAHSLWECDEPEFNRRFGTDKLSEYWRNAEAHPWFRTHPWKAAIKRRPDRCIPVRIHGDDAPCTKRTQIFVANLSPVCTSLQSWLSRFLLVCWPLVMAAGPQTLESFFSAFVWSLLLMAPDLDDVLFPNTGHNHQPLRGKRLARAGQRICGGYRFVLTQFCGDWKFLKEFFHFRQCYTKLQFCWLCLGTKATGTLCAWNNSLDAACFECERSSTAFLMFLRSLHHPLASYTGFDMSMIMLDLMHICLLGIMQFVVGGVLWELCLEQRWYRPGRGSWQSRTNHSLRLAFDDFKNWLKTRQLQSSHPLFTVLGLSMHTLADCPMLKVKAANCLLVCQWLSELCCADAHAEGDDYKKVRATTLWGFSETFSILQGQDHWISDTAAEHLMCTRAAALQGYNTLACVAVEREINRFPMKPKIHLFDHCMRDTCKYRENPTFCWCFSDEDFIGKIKRVASRCHPFRMGMRALQRWAMRYFAQLRNAKSGV